MFSYLAQGGLMMIPILLCSILSVAFAVERAWFIWDEHLSTDDFWTELEPLLENHEYDDALKVSRQSDGLVANLIESGLKAKPLNPDRVVDEMENYGMRQIPKLERFLPALNFIAQVSPLLGLLGTVAGMIETFSVIAQAGVGQPELLAGGISKALITTASGLAVGIVTLFFHHFFSQRIDQISHEMERTVTKIEDILQTNLESEVEN